MKNKIIFLCYFSFIVVSAKAQDTISNNLSRSSISFGGGVNITYPTRQNDWVSMSTSVQPCFSLSYNFLLHKTNNTSINLLIGGGYIIYTYVVWRNLGQPMKKNGINESIQINAGELFAGLNFNKKVGRHIWYNEIDLLEDARMHSIYRNPGGVPRSDLPYQNNWNSYLFYRTGLTFSIKRKFILTPFIAFPLLHIIPVDEQRNMLFGELKPFNSIRAGILLTYNFNKK